jgi:type IV secretory pathway VirB10-like protein
MFRHSRVFVVAAATLATVACAKPPNPRSDAAKAAVSKASAAEASEYAPEAFSAARDAHAKLDAELKAQEGKFAVTHSYDEATKLATAATEAGEKAASEAAQRKQAAQTEASTAVVDARAAIQDAETALSGAPKGKGSKADLGALQSDRRHALLAEIASRRSEAVLLSGEHLKAAVWTHDARILDRASRALDGD